MSAKVMKIIYTNKKTFFFMSYWHKLEIETDDIDCIKKLYTIYETDEEDDEKNGQEIICKDDVKMINISRLVDTFQNISDDTRPISCSPINHDTARPMALLCEACENDDPQKIQCILGDMSFESFEADDIYWRSSLTKNVALHCNLDSMHILCVSAACGSSRAIRVLLDSKFALVCSNISSMPLSAAIMGAKFAQISGRPIHSYTDIIAILIAYFPDDINKPISYREPYYGGYVSPLGLSCTFGFSQFASMLISAGVCCTNDGRTMPPILCAAAGDVDVDIVETLVGAGADINEKTPMQSETPLSFAAFFGRFDMVKKIVELKGDIHHIDADGKSVLDAAVMSFNTDVIKYLIDIGVRPDAGRLSCPIIACVMQIISDEQKLATGFDIIKILLDAGADINKIVGGISALSIATSSGNFQVAKFLIQHGAIYDIDQTCE